MVATCHATGVPRELGTFDYWTVHVDADLPLQEYLSDWIAGHLKGFSGIINVGTIGGRMDYRMSPPHDLAVA